MKVPNSRLPQIDVLRGFACLGVFFFHAAVIAGFPKRTLPPFEFLQQTWDQIPSIFSFGATGVSLFFVISGFCLTLKPLMTASPSLSIQTYAIERFCRVYPAYIVALLFTAFVGYATKLQWSLPEVLAHVFFLQGMIQEWHFMTGNSALWSMSTEAQFYLAFPAILFLFVRLKSSLFIGVVLVVTLVVRMAFANLPFSEEVYGGINTGTFLMNTIAGRLFDFSLGMFLAERWIKRPVALVRACRVAFIPLLLVGVFSRLKLPTWIADPALVLACGVFLGVMLGGKDISAQGPLAKFGRMSYSFFLLHFAVLMLLGYIGAVGDWSIYCRFLYFSGAGFLVTLIFGYFLYAAVEVGLSAWLKAHMLRRSARRMAGVV